MAEDAVLVEKRDGYVVITLNRPDRLNAFNETQHRTLMAAIVAAESDETCRAIVLTGAGRGFCAGQDLSDRDPSAGKPDLGKTIETFYNPLIRTLRSLRIPIICAVNGVAAGAGANIALACDIVVAARSAKFIQAFSKIGLIPDSGGTWTVTQLIGEARAKAIMLTGQPVAGETAAEWGMIWKAVDDDSLMAEAGQLAANLAKGPTLALARTKQLVQQAASNTLDRQLELERDTQRELGLHDNYAEGVAAFLEKRQAVFSGDR
jgi:2-(1,2-epoxy-1,2-dihydrophenyl)acetyl-CoA isomerase